MNCYYHPDREPVGSCVNCGRLICAECKVVLGGKIYCNPCADALVIKTAVSKNLNWFERHPNWTVILGFGAYCLIIVVIADLVRGEQPLLTSISDVRYLLTVWALYTSIPVIFLAGEYAYFIVYFLVPVALFFAICGWVLHQKKRSLWWLLLPFFIPLGWIVLLCLKTKDFSPPENSSA